MGMSLSAAKPIMEQNLKMDFSPLFEKAFYEALKTQAECIEQDTRDAINAGKLGEEPNIDDQKALKKGAKKFANELSGELAKIISDRIHDYVSEMMISVGPMVLLPTIISPVGPCTGSLQILPTDFKIM